MTEKSEQAEFSLREVVSGLDHPWGFAFLPGGDILITERSGQLRMVKSGSLDPSPVQGVPTVYASGQGGLLDIVLHPEFSDNNLLYLSFSSSDNSGAGTVVVRAKFDQGFLQEIKTIFTVEPKTSGRNHYGSRLVFAPDGTLLITIGDRYSFMLEAQNPANHLGAIVRINQDGSVPENNPFISKDGASPEIYSI
ncbi:MAG: PQQ-dependent sugar dehydrogenase, partial [bacterium]